MSYNDWEHIPGNNAGSYNSGGWKLLLHTTEGSTIAGAVAAYKKNNSWPHATISYEENRCVRHLDRNVAARSLSNNTNDGYETNRARCIQIEIVGNAAQAGSWTQQKLDWIATKLNEVIEGYPIPLTTTHKGRLGDKEFSDYAGLCEHRNAPDNDHWDCGDLDIQYITNKMGGSSPEPFKGYNVGTYYTEVNITLGSDGRGQFQVATPCGPTAYLIAAQPIVPFIGWDYGTGNVTVVGAGATRKNDGGISGYISGGKPNSKFDLAVTVGYKD